jgi:hypothetical protein
MANKYYYLVATLPFLSLGVQPSMTTEQFLGECEKWLSPADMTAIAAASHMGMDVAPAGGTVLGEWLRFDGDLRRELAKARTARKGGEERKIAAVAKRIMESETPLLMEMEMEKIRWEFLEDAAKNHFFDINRLVLYFLQLQILERIAGFDKDKGDNFFYKLCEVHYE